MECPGSQAEPLILLGILEQAPKTGVGSFGQCYGIDPLFPLLFKHKEAF